MSIIRKEFFKDFLDVKPNAIKELKKYEFKDIISSIKEIMENNDMNYLNGRFCETFINIYFSVKESYVQRFDKHMRLHNIHEFVKSTSNDPVDTKYYYPLSKTVYLGTCKCNHILSDDVTTIPFTKTEFHAVKERSKLISINDDFTIEYFILINQKIADLKRIVEENTGKNKIHIILEDDNIKYSEKELKFADENNILIEYLSDYFLKCKNILNECEYDISKIENKFDMLNKCILRPVQRYLVDSIVEDLKKYDGNEVLLGAFCRIGKTISALNIIKKYFDNEYKGKNIIFQTSYPSIFEDVIDDIYKVYSHDEVNIISDNLFKGEYDENKLNINLISTQYTVYEKSIKEKLINVLKNCDFYIFDEAHTASGTKLQRFVKRNLPKKCKTLYMTATPYTEYLKNITYKHLFMIIDRLEWVENGEDMSLDEIPLPMLIHMGFEYDKNKYRPESCNELLSGNVTEYLAFYLNQTLRYITNGIDTKPEMDKLKNSYPNNKKNHVGRIEYIENILVCVANVKQAKYLKDVLLSDRISNAYNINVEYSISSECDAKESISKVNAFFNKKYDVHTIKFFIVVGQLSTGVTIPNCDMVWWLRDSSNGIEIMQSCSRCLNIHKNNKGQYTDFGFWMFSSPKLELKFYDSLLEYGRKLKTNKMKKEVEYFMNSFYNVSNNKITHVPYLEVEKQLYDYTRSVSYNANIWNNEDAWCDFINEDKMDKFDNYEINISTKSEGITIETNANYESNSGLEKRVTKKELKDNFDSNELSDKELKTNEYLYNSKIIALVKKNIGHKLVSLIRTKDKDKIKKFLEGNPIEKLKEIFNEEFEGKTKFKYFFSEECFSQFNTFDDLIDYLKDFINISTWEENFNRLFTCILSKINNDEIFDIGEIIMDNNAVKDFGEVFTPIDTVKNMLDKIPEDFWKNKNHTILDNSMGTGIFLMESYNRFMNGLKDEIIDENERSKWIIDNCLYGVEIQEKNYIIAVESVLNGYNKNKHFVLHDALIEDDNFNYWDHMKFDAVVGNPPYNMPRKNHLDGSDILWDKFVFKALELLKDNGHLVYIHPIGWRQYESSTGLWDLMTSKNITFIKNISEKECKKIFHDVEQRIDYYHLENKPYGHKTIIDDNYGNVYECDLSQHKFLTSENFQLILKYLAKDDEETTKIIKPKKLLKDPNGLIPLIDAVTVDEKNIRYETTSKDNGSGIVKVIFPENGRKGRFKDDEGKYAVGQYCFAIECDKNDINEFFEYCKSEEMNNIIEALRWSVLHCKYQVFSLFKKKWWKNKEK